MSKTQTLFAEAFAALSVAINAYAKSIDAFDEFWCHVIIWHGIGEYPSNQELIAFLGTIKKPDGTPRWADSSLKVYASNILKWAKSNQRNKDGKIVGPQNPGNIKRMMSEHPEGHEKSAAGRKKGATGGVVNPKGQNDTPKEPTTLKGFLDSLRGMKAGLPKVTSSMAVMNAWTELIEQIKVEIARQAQDNVAGDAED